MRKRRIALITAIPVLLAALLLVTLPSAGSSTHREGMSQWKWKSLRSLVTHNIQVQAANPTLNPTLGVGQAQNAITQRINAYLVTQATITNYLTTMQQQTIAQQAAEIAQQEAAQQAAAQEAATQQAAAQSQASSQTSSNSGGGSTSSSSGNYSGDSWWRVAICEEGGQNNPTFGYFGILPSTWSAMGQSGTAGNYSYSYQEAVANQISGGSVPDANGCASW